MSFLVGLGIGLSLIVAIGAQNAFVLRQGARRQHVFVVALICATSDAILISLGVGGVGVALESAPWLIAIVRWGGVVFLVTYAVLAMRRALKPADEGLQATEEADSEHAATGRSTQPIHANESATATKASAPPATKARNREDVRNKTLWVTVLATLAITWLNPHVYLDTMIFLGSVAQAQGDGRWLFAIGAVTGSFVWFFALAYGARYLGRWLSNPKAWRVLDCIIAVFMIVIALMLAFGF